MQGGGAKLLPNEIHRRFARMQQVCRIEAVVPEFVHQDFVGWEILRIRRLPQDLIQSELESGLAERALVGPVSSRMAYGADTENKVLVGVAGGQRRA